MHWNTVSPQLREILEAAMSENTFSSFRLVGGTALSLQMGHRESIDIDLFTDAEYGAVDFDAIDKFFRKNYDYVDPKTPGMIGMGVTYFVGHTENDAVKLDIYYNEPFIRPAIESNRIRLASKEDIIAMKLDVIARGGRKKDFWDIHALEEDYDISSMISYYKERYPYGYSAQEILNGLQRFNIADNEPPPLCRLGKHWEFIKLDFVNWVKKAS